MYACIYILMLPAEMASIADGPNKGSPNPIKNLDSLRSAFHSLLLREPCHFTFGCLNTGVLEQREEEVRGGKREGRREFVSE